MRSLIVVGVEICGQSGLQLAHCFMLVGIDVLVFDAGPVFQQLPYAGPNQVGINLVFTDNGLIVLLPSGASKATRNL